MPLGNDATVITAFVLFLFLFLLWSLSGWQLFLARVRDHPAAVILLAAALTRFAPALLLDRGLPYDVEAHWWVGSIVTAGQNVYRAPFAQGRYPYPPLHAYLSALLYLISSHARSTFLFFDKALPAACGVALSLVVWAAACRLGYAREKAFLCGLLYALNPLAMLVTGYHGQFEEIPLLGVGLAYLLLLHEEEGRLYPLLLSALALGVAVAYKTWPLLFLPPLVLLVPRWPRRLLYVAIVPLPLATSLALFGLFFGRSGLGDAVSRMISYSGSTGFCWGYGSLVQPCWIHPTMLSANLGSHQLTTRLLLVALLVCAAFVLLRRRPLEGMVLLPLTFYLFCPGWGPNYSVWVVPFLILLAPALGRLYTLAILPSVASTYADSLYAAYQHVDFSWDVLKPIEAILGFSAWLAIAVLMGRIAYTGFSLSLSRLGSRRSRRASAVEYVSVGGGVEEGA